MSPFLLKELKRKVSNYYGRSQGEKFYHQFEYPKKLALVLGSESRGPINIIEADYRVKIPLKPLSESLNVAVAGGIILYEINRQRDPHQ